MEKRIQTQRKNGNQRKKATTAKQKRKLFPFRMKQINVMKKKKQKIQKNR